MKFGEIALLDDEKNDKLPSVEELVESWTGEHRISVTYQSTEENEEIRHYYQNRQKQKKLEMKQAKHPE